MAAPNVELKCSELGATELATRAVEPSPMSLLGLVRHLAEVERGWFRRVMDREADVHGPLEQGAQIVPVHIRVRPL